MDNKAIALQIAFKCLDDSRDLNELVNDELDLLTEINPNILKIKADILTELYQYVLNKLA